MRLFFSLLAFTAVFAFAQPVKVEHLDVNCVGKSECEFIKETLRSLKRTYVDVEHLKQTIELYVLNEGIETFEYSLLKKGQVYKLDIILRMKLPLLDYSVVVKKDPGVELPTVIPLREGDYVDDKGLLRTKVLLEEVIQDQGYPNAEARFDTKEKKEGMELEIIIDPGKPILVDRIRVNSDSPFLLEVTKRVTSRFLNKNFHLQEVKNTLEELRQLFIDYGYYLNDISLNYNLPENFSAELDIAVKNNELHVFYPEGGTFFKKDEIKTALKNSVLGYKRKLSTDFVEQTVKTLYAKKGFVDPAVSVKLKTYEDKRGEKVNHYHIHIVEDERTKISKIVFSGNSALDGKNLRKMFYESGPAVVKSGFFQKNHVDNFREIIRREYVVRGYVNVLVEEPRTNFSEGKAFISYRLREGVKAVVGEVEIEGAPADLEKDLKKIMNNTAGRFFNPASFKQDLEMIENRLMQEGYFYAQIKNKNSNNIVSYKNENSTVNINIEIDLDKKLYIDQIIIVGNRQTRSKLVRREILFKPGDKVTRTKIQESQTNLLGLGIFSSVLIEPIPNKTNAADILISVREKDFGVIELAPGVRTDLGLKLSANVTYNNLDGMNKRVSFKGQVNQRFNLNSLDERRREESNSLIEYDLGLNYAENHIFYSDLDFSSSISSLRRRFFSFDADIQRISYTLNKDFNQWFSMSFRQQYENIEQFDASLEREEGTFQIGSVTPGATLDFRNNRINPTSGSWFNLSMEVANPALLSQRNDELIINYYKVISRNRFYLPFTNGTLAMSMALGMQENLSKGDGYIPNIKVFRLNGADAVRGFEDDEINRLVSGQDVSEVEVNDKAYMAVLKVEPRIFLSDSSMFGVFYDAGRVFVDSYNTEDLRSSVGLTFKYLTPVGSLDFDYGIKLLRKRDDDGKVESPGRLHVSIGFF